MIRIFAFLFIVAMLIVALSAPVQAVNWSSGGPTPTPTGTTSGG